MRFHALLLVRDEADIIEQCLRQLVTWADAVYVFDTGSCDATWKLVCQFAQTNRQVIPLMQDAVFFSEKRLRGWLFHQARKRMREGDWFARVDADEFHHVNPREFVRTRLRPHETVVYHQYYDFRLTDNEVAAWQSGKESIADRERPIEQRRRWFTLGAYTEPRLCRYRETMQWPEDVSFPYNAGYVAVERLPIRHYPHRDPIQLQRRCTLRAMMMTEAENACNLHWNAQDWRKQVISDGAPGLLYWAPETDLPEPHFNNHLAPLGKRALQRIVHTGLLPVLDRLRRGYGDGVYPRRIRGKIQQQLKDELDRIEGAYRRTTVRASAT